MNCPRCGNEVSQEEAFCGQCGTPNTPPARPTAPFTSAQPNTHTFNPGTNYTPRTNMPASQAPYAPDQTSRRPPATNQQTGFYQDATEALSALPNRPGAGNSGYATGYQQQYPGSSPSGPQVQP